MQSRRDHLQAYQFAVDRLVRAIATGRTDAGDAPFRRSGLGVSMGAFVGVLGCAGALVYGLISPAPSSAWRNPGAIIVEKETGTRYLLIDGALHPTANYASALLAAGQNSSVQMVPRAQLAGIPIGTTIGIAGAPEDVPPAAALLRGPWAMCADRSGRAVLDLDPSGHTASGPAAQRVLVTSTDPGGPAEYVVWDSVKYPVTQQAVLPALGLGDQQPVSVHPAWLAALPTGAPIVPATIPGLGRPGPVVGGRGEPVGSLFTTAAGGTDENYVLLSDGLAPITRTESALLLVAGLQPPLRISTAAIAAAPASPNRSLLARLPDLLSGPVFSATDSSLCVLQSSPGSASDSQLVTEKASAVAADPAVVVPPGAGMLVESPGQSQSAQPVAYFVADTGERYLIGGQNAISALGYGSASPVVMPASVLGVIPDGPVLDVNNAKQAVKWQSG
jgi:type VII secretion protein EccB